MQHLWQSGLHRIGRCGRQRLKVERRHAKLLTTEDYIVFEHDPSQMAKVFASSASMSKGNLWYLALESFGSGQVDPERYYNCIP